MSVSIRRFMVIVAAFALFALALAPAGFAGEDDDDDDGAASGGVQTGAGGMVASTGDGSLVLPFALAGGGLVLLTLGGAGALGRREGR